MAENTNNFSVNDIGYFVGLDIGLQMHKLGITEFGGLFLREDTGQYFVDYMNNAIIIYSKTKSFKRILKYANRRGMRDGYIDKPLEMTGEDLAVWKFIRRDKISDTTIKSSTVFYDKESEKKYKENPKLKCLNDYHHVYSREFFFEYDCEFAKKNLHLFNIICSILIMVLPTHNDDLCFNKTLEDGVLKISIMSTVME